MDQVILCHAVKHSGGTNSILTESEFGVWISCHLVIAFVKKKLKIVTETSLISAVVINLSRAILILNKICAGTCLSKRIGTT